MMYYFLLFHFSCGANPIPTHFGPKEHRIGSIISRLSPRCFLWNFPSRPNSIQSATSQ